MVDGFDFLFTEVTFIIFNKPILNNFAFVYKMEFETLY